MCLLATICPAYCDINGNTAMQKFLETMFFITVSNVDMSAGIMDLKKVIYDNCNVSTGSGLNATISDSVTNLATSVSYLIQLFIVYYY